MKTLKIYLMLLIFFYGGLASAKGGEGARQFLSEIAGYYQGKDCEVSITTTDVVVRDRKGREAYLPFVFDVRSTSRSRYLIQQGSRALHYEYEDLNRDPENGRYSIYIFEAVKTADLTALKYVELGVREAGAPRIFWMVCKLR